MRTSSRPLTARLAVILGILTAFGPLSIDMYLPGLPAIGAEFGADTAAAQLTLSLFFVGLATGQALYGPLSDRLGRKWPLLFGCALYTLASLGCALAPSLGSLVALRTAFTTTRIRLRVTAALASYSRITEIEAWGN